MRLDDMISGTISRVIGRFVKRAVAGFFLVLFALAVIYQLTAAGTLALGEAYGMVTARLLIAGLFALAAGGAVAFLMLTRAKPDAKPENILRQPRTLGHRHAARISFARIRAFARQIAFFAQAHVKVMEIPPVFQVVTTIK